MDLIYIYMITSDVEYLSMYLLDSSVPFLLEKCLFRSSAYFFISIFFELHEVFVYFGHGKVTILHKIFLKKKNMCWKYQIFAKDLTYPLMHSL